MRFSIAISTAALGMGALMAQEEQPPGARPAHNAYLLRGCLKAGEATDEFMLTNATAVGPAPPAGEAEPGAAGTEGRAYRLQPVRGVTESGVASDELKMHVGSFVEVTVRPAEPAAPAPPDSAVDAPVEDVASPQVASPAESEPEPLIVTIIARQRGTCS